MSDTIIKVEGLGKKYSIQHQQEGRQYRALRDVIADGAKSLARPFLGKDKDAVNPSREDFWALKDVNFEIKQGDRVGIIGRNGAGKSTLLKVLSRIVEPTEGRISIKGRVASLLEVGTGFHPELTGRENIYLNGAILGMGRAEIKRKFDEIVDFAEVEKFLDTPVKRYSSGMYVRLAFAVAAHLEPEILIVDEVLAVGDAQFQKKCLGKMEDVASGGRTVIFVSHNMGSISTLCSKAMLLKGGTVEHQPGNVEDAIQQYSLLVESEISIELQSRKDRTGSAEIKITRFQVLDKNGRELEYVKSGQYIEFRIYFESGIHRESLKHKQISFGISISHYMTGRLIELSNDAVAENFENLENQNFVACKIKKLPLPRSKYWVNLIVLKSGVIQDWIQEACLLDVEDGDFFGSGISTSEYRGVLLEQDWCSGYEKNMSGLS